MGSMARQSIATSRRLVIARTIDSADINRAPDEFRPDILDAVIVFASDACRLLLLDCSNQLFSKTGRDMARRNTGNLGHMNDERYLGNTATKEVHDLDQEDTAPNGCQIDEIIGAGHDRPFGTLAGAHAAGYDNCAKCVGESTR